MSQVGFLNTIVNTIGTIELFNNIPYNELDSESRQNNYRTHLGDNPRYKTGIKRPIIKDNVQLPVFQIKKSKII